MSGNAATDAEVTETAFGSALNFLEQPGEGCAVVEIASAETSEKVVKEWICWSCSEAGIAA